MKYQKIIKLLGSTLDKVPRFITKKWIEVYDQSGGTYNTNKQIRFKTSMLRSDLCDYSDHIFWLKEKLLLQNVLTTMLIIMPMIKSHLLKIMHHLFHVFQT